MHKSIGHAGRRQQSRPGIGLKHSETRTAATSATAATASVAFVEGADPAEGRAVVYDRTVVVLDFRAVLERDAEHSSRVGRVPAPELDGVRTTLRRRSRGLRTEFTAEVRATDERAAGEATARLLREVSRVAATSESTLETRVARRPSPANPDSSLVRSACEDLRRAGYEIIRDTLWADPSDADLHLALDAKGRELFRDLGWLSAADEEERVHP